MINFLIDRLLEPLSPVPALAREVYSDEHMGWQRETAAGARTFKTLFLPRQAGPTLDREGGHS